jgi:DegV family protein with EDD domain
VAHVALVTDTTADLPPALASELGVQVARAGAAFSDHFFEDGELAPAAFFARMREREEAPRPAAASEASLRRAFGAALDRGDAVVCLVMPFDVAPTFTTAGVLALELESARGRRIKVINPGVASAGLGALVCALHAGVGAGWEVQRFAAAVDEYAPLCDALFLPAELSWLERSGRLALIEDKLGRLGEEHAVVRLGTRITGVLACESRRDALERLVQTVGLRAGDRPLIVSVDHAGAPEQAERLCRMMEKRWKVDRLIQSELSSTFGSQLGPGSVGIGVAPRIEL